MIKQNSKGIALTGRKIVKQTQIYKGVYNMLNTLKSLFGKDELVKVKTVKRTVATETRGRKSLSKKTKSVKPFIKRWERCLENYSK